MAHTLIGYARCSTDKQDLAAQKDALHKLGVAPDRIYTVSVRSSQGWYVAAREPASPAGQATLSDGSASGV